MRHIETVRDIQRSMSDVEFKQDLKSLLAGFRARIPELIPGVDLQSRQDGLNLYLDPDHAWRITKSHWLEIHIGFEELADPYFLNDWDDPWVGLSVPPRWRGFRRFSDEIRQKKPNRFKDWSEDEENTDLSVPIWQTVQISKFAGKSVFDTEGFYRALANSVKALLAKKKPIATLIEKINTSQKKAN